MKENKEIMQSYVLTVARYDANVYVKRIMTHIVSANQDYVQSEKLGGCVLNIDEDLFCDREYTFDIKNILQGDEDKNYKRVKKAFEYLQSKFLRFDNAYDYVSVPFINAVKIKNKTGIATFRMSELIYKAFADFTKGFRKLEFELTLSFTSIYSIRLYELMAGQKEPLTYTIDYLKEIFCIENKYQNKPTDFIKRVIVPAKKELDAKSSYTFEYKINKKGRAYHSITFYPIYQPQFRNEDLEEKSLQKQLSISWILDKNTKDYLKYNFEFTDKEIKQNLSLFERANKELDLVEFASKIKIKIRNISNPKGYLINAIKRELGLL